MKEKKFIIIRILILVIFIITIMTCINIINKNNNDNISIKYIDEINSSLYEEVVLYDYNNISNNYTTKKVMLLKNNIYMQIFNYYNNDNKYEVINIICENNVINYKIKSSNKEMDYKTYKLIKLTLNSLNINELQINIINNK